MKAALYYAKEDVRIEDVETPRPGPGEVQIKVALNGICGSDLHEYFDGPRAVPMEPHPLTGVQAPVILGHETAGYVTSLGPGVSDLTPGDLVVIDPIRPCGICRLCREGATNLCDRLAMHGFSTGSGGLAQFAVAPAVSVHPTPAGMTPMQAALVEPFAVAAHAVGRWSERRGGRAAIFGGGPIGIAIMLTLRASGIDEVWVVEPASVRRQMVEQLGGIGIDPTLGPSSEYLREATDGRGVDVSFETAGAKTSFADAVASTAKLGSVVVVASGRHSVIAPLAELVRSELTVRTTYASCGEFGAVLGAMQSGLFPLEGWVSVLPLDDLVNGLHRLHGGLDVKLVVDPWAGAAGS